MWKDKDASAHSRIDSMEKQLVELQVKLNEIPEHIDRTVHDAMAAHEAREGERIGQISNTISNNILVAMLGEDLATGPEAARNKRALQQMLRQGVLMAPMIIRMQTRLLWIMSTLILGMFVISSIGAGAILDFIKGRLGL